MKKGIHPENYRLVAFKDMSNNDVFITKSAVETKDTISVDGAEYPLVKLEISRTSHPYYTGKTKLVDTAGRIDKFKSRYANLSLKKQSTEEAPEAPVVEEAPEAPVVEEAPEACRRSSRSSRSQLLKKLQKPVVEEAPEAPVVEEAEEPVVEEAPSSEDSSEEEK